MGPLTLSLVALFGILQVTTGGYVPANAQAYYPSYYPTFVKQPVIQQTQYLRPVAPVTVVQVPQKQPLQLRPPAQAVQVALPNTRPPVVAIHAQQPVQTINTVPVQNVPVLAIHAQQPPRKIVLPVPAQQIVSVPNYSYSYAVKDATTGDEKSHEETRNGDNVIGRYTVVEPDGTLRTVTYTAGIHGFNAVVERTPGYAPPNAPPKVVAVSKPVAVAVKPVAFPQFPASSVPVYPAGFHFGG
ncbi:unnamed protein product [Orchesella dallaii]|uniref:Cuticle protein n=1 Tax=Orchesella dallaii TaxID=48710 RepID=A0ABP1Q4H0_9HEXA